jgi:hypothetical protein
VVFKATVPSATQVQHLVPALITDASGDIYNAATHSPAYGCLATWFTLGSTIQSVTAPRAGETVGANVTLPSVLSPGTYYYGVRLTLVDSGTNQNRCENTRPEVTLTAS